MDRNSRYPDVTVLLCKGGTSRVLIFPALSPDINKLRQDSKELNVKIKVIVVE